MPETHNITQAYMEFQAVQIESVLNTHKAPIRVRGGTASPRWMQFLLQTAPGVRISRLRMLREELSLALGSADVQITRSGRQLALEVVRSDSRPIDLQSVLEQLDRLPPLTACLGLTADGRPLMLRLP